MPGSPTVEPTQIDLYWRPGCGFCTMLRRQLDQLGIERVEHNIWDDPADAAVVRDHANGNETVPTVVVGDVGFVNPSSRQLVDHLVARAPHLLPEGFEPPSPGPVARVIDKLRGV
jgi:glutaredoxin